MGIVYIIGFMGTGKSSAGREIARLLEHDFIDLDSEIEARRHKTIKDIFAQDGEPFFRRLESELLREMSERSRGVIACGGGIVLDEENIAIMRKSGKVICLTASPEEIQRRTSASQVRPLLNTGSSPGETIRGLLEKRLPLYRRAADIIIDTTGKSCREVADEAAKKIRGAA